MEITKPQDIALIVPPHRMKEHRYSLGLLYVSGYLRDHGFDNIIVENQLLGGKDYQYLGKDQAQKDIIAKVIAIKPKIIGFTASTIEINDVIAMNQEIRQRVEAVSIIGGPHVTAAHQEVLKRGFDVAVIGEGEQTALYLHRLISPIGIRVTRLARGLPFGTELEYADDVTLTRAIEGRQEF